MSPRRRSDHGFTLVEMMIVIAIVGMMLSVSALAFRNLTKADLRSSASRTAASMRLAFDRSLMSGSYLRLAIDMEKGALWLEHSEDRVSLQAGREQHATDKATDEDNAQHEADKPSSGTPLPFGMGLGGAGGDEEGVGIGIDVQSMIQAYERELKPVKRARARFKKLKGYGIKTIKLKASVVVVAVMTARMAEPADKGTAYVYFFPQGHAEPAIVHLKTESGDDYYSVVLHPLTGQARIYSCRYRIPEEFGQQDDGKRRRSKKDVCEDPP